MDIGVSPLTCTIFAGKSKPLPNGKGRQWVGKKTDITDAAVRAVFEYMFYQAEMTGHFEISYPELGVMSFKREKKNPNEKVTTKPKPSKGKK